MDFDGFFVMIFGGEKMKSAGFGVFSVWCVHII